jgi:integrase
MPPSPLGIPPLSVESHSEVVNLALWMKREGYSPTTIKDRTKTIRRLFLQLGTLLDGDSVKEWVANQSTAGGTKLNILKAYGCYCKWKGYKFQFPKVQDTESPLPFIPLESELDQLIAGSGRKLSTVLRTMKETGCRVGEVLRLEWTDLDPETGVLNIRAEKGSKNRQCKISPNLVAMMMRLPRKDKRVFPGVVNSLRTNFGKVRKRLSLKLENPRLLKIHFHSFRHWFATKTYWKTRDILYTQKVLGHRDLQSTLRYTQLVEWKAEDTYHSKAARNTTEAELLVSEGWEYVLTTPDGVMLFRRRS